MRRMLSHILCFCVPFLMLSCIENDLSYPDVPAEILSFEVEGQESVQIDRDSCTVDIVLDELSDISRVRIVSCTLTDGAYIKGGLPEYMDLTSPVELTACVYEDLVWTISAVQPIDRYIRCDNQVGEAEIDPVRKSAYVYVTEQQSLMDVKINELKLEPEGSVVRTTTGFISENGHSVPKIEACSFPMVLDCVIMRYFLVEYEGEEIEWSVKVLQKKIDVSISDVVPWAYSADVSGHTNGKGTPVFEYRKSSQSDWTTFSDVLVTGTKVTARLTGLEEGTSYVVRLSNGTDASAELEFTTDVAAQLENMNFDQWHQGNPHQSWYPFAEGTEGIWGTANPGTNFANTVNPSRPEYDHVAVSGGAAVRLESLKALGVFAAGNIFTGSFDKFSFADMSAYLSWGTPFTSRPYALRGYYDYAPVNVDNAPNDVSGSPNPYRDMKGKADYMQILVALVAEATDEADKGPFSVVSSKPGVPDLKNDPRVIAYGAIEADVHTGGSYKEFECVLQYNDDRTPAYVIVVACSSLRGHYFTGGLGSVLYVDDFSFIYR